jgi:hypothetical protein
MRRSQLSDIARLSRAGNPPAHCALGQGPKQ